MKQTTLAFSIGIGCIIIALSAFAYFSPKQIPHIGEEEYACTLEALVCPDGQGVGRSGPECRFTPCPQTESFTGTLLRQGNEYRLVIPTPPGIGQGVTYALPLIFQDQADVSGLINAHIRVFGIFTEGNTYQVDSYELVTSSGTDDSDTEAILLGESKLVRGVQITPLRVVEDSRCPVDVTCIWTGQLRVETELQSDTERETVTLTLGGEPQAFDTFLISLTQALPEPESERTTEPGYELTYTVTYLSD